MWLSKYNYPHILCIYVFIDIVDIVASVTDDQPD